MPVFSVFNIRKDNESKDGWIGLLLFEIDTFCTSLETCSGKPFEGNDTIIGTKPCGH